MFFQKTMKELQAERDYLTGRKEDLREKRDTMRKERAAFRAEKEALAAELSSLKEDYRVSSWPHARIRCRAVALTGIILCWITCGHA